MHRTSVVEVSAERSSPPQETFAQTAKSYLDSPSHRRGPDLDLLVVWSRRANAGLAVDVATGGGHTARAVAATGRMVLATDLTVEMVETAATEDHELVQWAAADATAQPLPSGSAALLTCRIAPHHFVDLRLFLNEARRVLAPDGTLIIADNISHPSDKGWLNHVERLRDPSHVRSYTKDEWKRWLTRARFEITDLEIIPKTKSFSDWLYRTRPDGDSVQAVTDAFRHAPPDISRLHHIKIEGSRIVSWQDQKIVVAARPE